MKFKFLLIAAYNTLILQFREAAHYVESSYEDETTGDRVNFISGDGPDIRITSSGGADEKKLKYTVTVQVPKGPGLRKAVTLELQSNKVRDRIASLLKAASTTAQGEGGVEVVLTGDEA